MAYIDHAITQEQRAVAECLDRGSKSSYEIAAEIGKDDGWTRRTIVKLKQRAAPKEIPEHNSQIPDGYKIKGTSTLYKDGQPALQWVKTSQDAERQAELMREVIDELKKEVPRLKKSKPCKSITISDLLNCYVITDYHIGMLSWHEESGINWNTEISEDFLERWFSQAIKQAPDAHTAIFSEIGDWLHSDGLDAVTPTSGTLWTQTAAFRRW